LKAGKDTVVILYAKISPRFTS